MAQIPNYYYNSPYIADAAKSLASALAPPDPEKKMAYEAAQFGLQRAKTKAGYEDADRVADDEAGVMLGQLEGFQPIIDPKTGKIDYDATDRGARTLGEAVIKRGGLKWAAAVDKAMGTASPQHAVRQATLAAQARYNVERDNNRGAITLNLNEMKEGHADARNAATNAARLEGIRLRNEGNINLEIQKALRRNPNVNVKQMPAASIKLMIESLDDLEYQYGEGARLSQIDYDRYIDLAIQRALTTGNPMGAVLDVWKENPPAVQNADQSGFWGDAFRSIGGNLTDPKLAPKWATPTATAPQTVIDAPLSSGPQYSDAMPGAGAEPKKEPKKPKVTAPPAPRPGKKPSKPIESYGR